MATGGEGEAGRDAARSGRSGVHVASVKEEMFSETLDLIGKEAEARHRERQRQRQRRNGNSSASQQIRDKGGKQREL